MINRFEMDLQDLDEAACGNVDVSGSFIWIKIRSDCDQETTRAWILFDSVFLFQGETPKQRAEKANDQELAEYLENRQHYQMIQREDQETAVWRSLCPDIYSQLSETRLDL